MVWLKRPEFSHCALQHRRKNLSKREIPTRSAYNSSQRRHSPRSQYGCLGKNRPHQWADPRNPSPLPTQPVWANARSVSKGHLGGPWLFRSLVAERRCAGQPSQRGLVLLSRPHARRTSTLQHQFTGSGCLMLQPSFDARPARASHLKEYRLGDPELLVRETSARTGQETQERRKTAEEKAGPWQRRWGSGPGTSAPRRTRPGRAAAGRLKHPALHARAGRTKKNRDLHRRGFFVHQAA